MNRNLRRMLACGLSLAAILCADVAPLRAADQAKPALAKSAQPVLQSAKPAQPAQTPAFVIHLTDPPAAANRAAAPVSRFLIGVICQRADDTLHAQLPELPKGQGLVVAQVLLKGPADKAGIRPNDILLAAAGKPLALPADLTVAVEAAQATDLSLTLLRGGKTMTVAVKPEKHAFAATGPLATGPLATGTSASGPLATGPLGAGSLAAGPTAADRRTVEKWIRQFNPQAAGSLRQWNVRVFHAGPAMLLPPGVGAKLELPDDLSVDIFRQGKQPAKITVKKANQTWQVAENELDKLPPDIRRFVEPLLATGPVRIELKSMPAATGSAATDSAATGPLVPGPLAGVDPAPGNPAGFEGRVEKRLDEMSRRLDAVQAALDRLGARRRAFRRCRKDACAR